MPKIAKKYKSEKSLEFELGNREEAQNIPKMCKKSLKFDSSLNT